MYMYIYHIYTYPQTCIDKYIHILYLFPKICDLSGNY